MKHRRSRSRLPRRALRALAGIGPLQWAVTIAVVLLATVGIAVGTAILIHRTNPTDPVAEGPVLRANPSLLVTPTVAPTTAVPDTVRLIIPAGDIDIPVIPGDGTHIPLHLAMHYPGTAEPGAGSNSLFYAHAQPGMFQGLYRLRLGDAIRAIRSDGSEVDYQVRGLTKVPFNDGDVLNPTPFEQITLLTCTSYNPSDPRYIVTATPA